MAGTWADSVSLQALATASNLDLRIWAYDPKLKRWNYYLLVTADPKHKSPQVVYLRLQDEHYQLLVPRKAGQGPTDQVVKEWREVAIHKPTTLRGAGRSLDPDMLSCMGIKPPSTLPPKHNTQNL